MDEHTVKYTFDEPVILDYTMPNFCYNFVALPEHLLADEDPADYLNWEFWDAPVGSGPMKFVSEIPGTEVVYETNKDYHMGAANFDTFKFIYMEDANIPSALISGDIDCAFSGMTSDDLNLLKDQENLCVYEVEFATILRSIFINNAVITDKRVRRALDISIDRETIAELLEGDVVSTPILPSSEWYDETAGVEYDPETAKELLAEAAADGAINLDEPIVMVVANAIGEKYSTIVQQNWEAIGLKVELQKMENAAMLAGYKADEVYLGTINRMLSASPIHMHYSLGSGYLKTAYPYEENKAEFFAAETEEERHEVINEFQHIWKEEATSIIMAACYEDYAYNTRLNSTGGSLGLEAITTGGGAIPIWTWGNE